MPPPETADQHAAQAVVDHHTALSRRLETLTAELLEAAERDDPPLVRRHRDALVDWVRAELLPHAHAEEITLYAAAAARPEGAPLVAGMRDEHQAIGELVNELSTAASPVRAAASARALSAVFATHLAKENELILPMLVNASDVSLAGLLAGMHDLIGGHAGSEPAPAGAGDAGGCGCGGCGCGAGDAEPAPEAAVLSLDARLDVRDIPPRERHSKVLAALAELAPDGALVLVAPHAPRPLLTEIDRRFPGQFDVEWLQSGPEVWQLRLERVALPVPAGEAATPGS